MSSTRVHRISMIGICLGMIAAGLVTGTPASSTTAGKRPVWRELPIVIIIIAGLFHIGRGADVDGFVFVTTGVALVFAELRDRPAPAPAAQARREPLSTQWILAGALLCMLYGLVAGGWNLASPTLIL